MAAHFLIRKKLFNSKCTQLLVAKDFAVAEKKLHLAISGRKYDPGKKAYKRKCTSDVKTADPKPSTSQDKSISEQQPQDKSFSEQQSQDESVSEQQPQDEPVPEQQQDVPATKQQQDKASDTLTSLSTMIVCQIMAQLSKFLQQKIPVLYQRNRDTVYVRKPNIFNLLSYFSLQIKKKRNSSHILENSHNI